MTTAIKPTFYGVQALRGLAATMVVISHIGNIIHSKTGIDVQEVTAGGWAGVDIFFVISGFIMVYTTERSFSAGTFLGRRLIRVVPLYWIATGVYAIAATVLHRAQSDGGFGIGGYIAALLFLPVTNGAGEPYPPLAQGWTLVYEMFFYIVLALVAIRFRRIRTPLLIGIFTSLAIAGSLWRHDNLFWRTYTNPILLEFTFGCIIAEIALLGKIAIPKPLAVSIATLGFIGVCVATPFRDGEVSRAFYWGLPAAMLVFGFVCLENKIEFRKMHFVQAIGDSSYSLYLFHIFVLTLLFDIPVVRTLGVYGLPAELAICWAAGYACFVLIEAPITGYLRTGPRQKGPVKSVA